MATSQAEVTPIVPAPNATPKASPAELRTYSQSREPARSRQASVPALRPEPTTNRIGVAITSAMIAAAQDSPKGWDQCGPVRWPCRWGKERRLMEGS